MLLEMANVYNRLPERSARKYPTAQPLGSPVDRRVGRHDGMPVWVLENNWPRVRCSVQMFSRATPYRV